MRRLAFIVTFIVGALGLAQFVSHGFVTSWEPQLRAYLETIASRATHSTVHIGNISPSFLHRVRLVDIRVTDPLDPKQPVFQAGEIDLTVSFIDLPRALLHRRPYEAIGLISVKNPRLRLSAELVQRKKAVSDRTRVLPPWFTLAWEGGVVEWLDARAPQGAITLEEARGVFRIRGPKMSLAMKATMQDGNAVRLDMGSLGQRWNAHLHVRDADLQSTLSIIQSMMERQLLPEGVAPQGRYDLEINAGGQKRPQTLAEASTALEKAKLTLRPPNGPRPDDALTAAGTLTYARGHLTSPKLKIDSPLLQAEGHVDVSLEDLSNGYQTRIQASLGEGRLGPWPFQKATIDSKYLHEHWEFQDNSIQFLEGQVAVKGYVSSADSNLSITAQQLSLSALSQQKGFKGPEGRINASCTLKGPLSQWEASGSWWMTNLQWGASMIGDAKGDFEFNASHFRAQAKSPNSKFRLDTDGSWTPTDVHLHHLNLYLPSGASLISDVHWRRQTQQVSGSFEASQVAIPSDLPFFTPQKSRLKGTVGAEGRLGGTLQDPSVKGSLKSADLHLNDLSLGKIAATGFWSKSRWDLSTVQVGTFLTGRFRGETNQPGRWWADVELHDAPAALVDLWNPKPLFAQGTMNGSLHLEKTRAWIGNGTLTLRDALLGKVPVPFSQLHFNMEDNQLQISSFTARSDSASLQWHGQLRWPGNEARTIDQIHLMGQGDLHALPDEHAWSIPFVMNGDFTRKEEIWSGKARLRSDRPILRDRVGEPLEGTFEWNGKTIRWSDLHWGTHWRSKGSYDWTQSPGVWAASIEALRVPLNDWQPLLFPTSKEPLSGQLSGTFNVTGPAATLHGLLDFSLTNGRWRRFQFASSLTGEWGAEGIKPLTIKGRMETGGEFSFTGLLTSEKEAQGTLKLSDFNLKPLGESLQFPKSVEGLSRATFTLRGPLNRLVMSGHMDAGPIVYGKETGRPFTLQEMVMDLSLTPPEKEGDATRLTFTEARVKTAEELIRIQPGGFIDFAGKEPARIRLGTEIRNLHLGLFTLFGGLDVDGTWQIKPEGFALQTRAQTHSLFINDYELEEGQVKADYDNGILTFSAPPGAPDLIRGTVNFHRAPQLQFTNFSISGKNGEALELAGDIGPQRWDFQLLGHHLDMGILGEIAGFPYPFSGSADVQVSGTGDPKHPHVEGKVQLDRGTAMGLAYRTGSATFLWQDRRITFTRLTLSHPGHYNLEGAGVIPLLRLRPDEANKEPDTETHPIDFSIRLQDSNLSLLQSISNEIKSAKGPVEGLVQIKGTLEDPSLHGKIRITDGEILGAHYFRHLKNASLVIDLDGDRILFQEVKGKSGEGEFRGSGSITLSGFQPSKYDLQLAVTSKKGLEVQVPELAIPESPLAKRFGFLTSVSKGDLRGQVKLVGLASAPVFSGTGIISNGHFTFPPSHKRPANQAVLAWFRRITWDVDLKFQDGAWFENELVQAVVSGNLQLKGPSDKLRVDGGLDIGEGQISYLGLQFKVQQARYDIRSEVNGDTVINTPYVRGVADSQIQTVDTVSGVAGSAGGSRLNINDVITLNIDYAPVDQIKPRLTSAANPTMSQDKVLARVTQTDVENLTPQERNYLYQKQLVSLIDNSLTTPLAQNVLKKTGLADRVRVQHVIDPNTSSGLDLNAAAAAQQQSPGGTSLLKDTKYTIEKDFFNKLSIGYGFRFIQSPTADPVTQQQKLDLVSDVQLSYRWFRNIYLKGDFELPTSNPNIQPERKVTIEPRWRFGWWGNTNKDKEKPKSSQ